MPRISTSIVISAPPDVVWADLAQVATHVEWMADAVAIRFTTERTAGVGTAFECDTKVGPLRTTDVMTITEWEPGTAMGVRHEGVVRGVGRFTLDPVRGERTRFTWEEELTFPPWLGGRAGAWLARPVLHAIWRRNLRRLAARF